MSDYSDKPKKVKLSTPAPDEKIILKALCKSLETGVGDGSVALLEFKKICCIFAKTSPDEFGSIVKKHLPFLYDYYRKEIVEKLLVIA